MRAWIENAGIYVILILRCVIRIMDGVYGFTLSLDEEAREVGI